MIAERRFRALLVLLSAVVFLGCATSALGQKKKSEETRTRSLKGTVVSADDAPVPGAVVQLKDTKTLQIRSFVAQEDGSFYFNGLNTDVDYELRADFQGASSPTRTLSTFDSRKEATITLKLNKNKKSDQK
jgi:hypothetical protein